MSGLSIVTLPGLLFYLQPVWESALFSGVWQNHLPFLRPPDQEAESTAAAAAALQYSFFHWGLHPWAIYAIVALTLAYFKFRKDAPGVIQRYIPSSYWRQSGWTYWYYY